MSEKEQQFERIYKETEEFGRIQFVREIQMQINDNKKKDKEIERLNNIIEKAIFYIKDFENKFKGFAVFPDKRFLDLEELLNILNGGDEE